MSIQSCIFHCKLFSQQSFIHCYLHCVYFVIYTQTSVTSLWTSCYSNALNTTWSMNMHNVPQFFFPAYFTLCHVMPRLSSQVFFLLSSQVFLLHIICLHMYCSMLHWYPEVMYANCACARQWAWFREGRELGLAGMGSLFVKGCSASECYS